MGYAAFLKPRKQVISEEGIEGIIDLANLSDTAQNKLESRPEDFFSLTYATSDVRRVIERLNQRFKEGKDVPGLFLFEGLRGSGKSHLLLLVYNLLKNQKAAKGWLAKNDLTCELPVEPVVVVNKFTDSSTYSIWDLVFSKLGETYKGKDPIPKLKDLRTALGDKHIVLIFDELEQGIRIIDDPAVQQQNIAFLQMLSEFSNRSKQVTILASIYSDREEPGSTLKRVPCVRVQFSDSQYEDRSNVILHRLFKNAASFDKTAVSPVIDSYVQQYSKHTEIDVEEARGRFAITYPFTPYVMDIFLKKIPARGGFQNVRGALGFLANLVKLTHNDRDLITSGDASLSDQETTIRLSDLDVSGDLIRRAKDNLDDLSEYEYSTEIASSVLLSTLADTSTPGISRDHLIQEVWTPDKDINHFEKSLLAFQKYASYFHFAAEEQRYFFDLEENAEAKVEFASLKISDQQARETLNVIHQKEVFKETVSSVIFEDISQTQEQLNQLDKKRLRYVLGTRRLSQEERHKLYFGLENRNVIVLLEPKDEQFQLGNNKDLLKWAKRCIAGENLATGTTDNSKRNEYLRIVRSDKGNILDAIKKADLVFVHWEKYGESVSDDVVELEPISGDCSKEKVLNALNQDYFPMLVVKEHVESRISDIKERLVREIDAEYRATLGFPVPVMATSVSKAVRELCQDGAIGIQHVRGSFCKELVALSEAEFFNAKITSPFDTAVEKCPRCGQLPCVCEKPEEETCPVCGKYPCVCGGGEQPQERCPRCGKVVCICHKVQTRTIGIPSQPNRNTLRQQTAFKLQEETDFVVTRVTYEIFYQRANVGDMSILPASLRGNLSGQGGIEAEIRITKSGEQTKSQIEQQIESLPDIPDAEYSARIDIRSTREGD